MSTNLTIMKPHKVLKYALASLFWFVSITASALTFADGDYKYMPTDNKININADISGNTFAGNVNNIDTAGGFYGEDAKFLGGVYQEALAQGGKGVQPGEGTTFQGTFGAEKQ